MKHNLFACFFLLLSVVIGKVRCISEQTFALIGVSGTLQDGFELRDRLDYSACTLESSNCDNGQTLIPAQLVGKALVRGYKSYLDIKQKGWREYKEDPPQVPNPVVLPTGCFHDANVYWVYLVAPQQVLRILAGEPRYLSISPDTGLVDLTAPETSDIVKRLAQSQIQKLGFTNQTAFALPLVTGTWFDAQSFVESPVVFVKQDGTRVTSFDESLALWAGVDRNDLLADGDLDRRDRAWKTVLAKAKEAEMDATETAFPKLCHDAVRFGVSNDHLRLNYPLTEAEIQAVVTVF